MKTAENVIDSNQDINEEAEDNKFAENETVSENKDGGHTTRSGRVVTIGTRFMDTPLFLIFLIHHFCWTFSL